MESKKCSVLAPNPQTECKRFQSRSGLQANHRFYSHKADTREGALEDCFWGFHCIPEVAPSMTVQDQRYHRVAHIFDLLLRVRGQGGLQNQLVCCLLLQDDQH